MWQWKYHGIQGRRLHWGIRNAENLENEKYPLVLFVHGAGSRAQHWLPVANQLPAHYCLLVVDRPGLGDSEGPPCASLEETVDLIAEWLDSINVNRSFIYVGHSMGGFIGMTAILQKKMDISALVLVASFAQYRVHPDFMRKLREGCYGPEEVKPGFSLSVPAAIFERFVNDMEQTDVISVLRDFEMIDGCSLTGQLSHVNQRTLIVAGQVDWITPIRQANWLHRGITSSQLVMIPQGGHYLLLEQPEAVARQIEMFCETLNQGKATISEDFML